MPAHAYRLIVFDYDGTLVDSQHNIVAAMGEAFTASGLPAPPATAVRQVVGLSLEAALEELLGEQAQSALPRVAQAYRDSFLAMRLHTEFHEPLFEDVRETLLGLNQPDVSLGIATGKAMRGLRASLERHQISGLFVTLQTADRHPSKPHPAMLRQAMAEAGAEAQETVLVGDTSFDMAMARSAEVAAIGVSYGYHGAEDLRRAGAAAIIDAMRELPAALSALAPADEEPQPR